jgi:hypothetical protein
MKTVGALLLGGFVALSFWASQVHAFPPFKKAFEKKYVAESTNDDFKDAEKAAGCSVCHVKGAKDKSARNAYGKALAKYTGGHLKKDIDAAKEAGGDDAGKPLMEAAMKTLAEAFDKVESEKAPGGGTFGERLKVGKLPVDVPAGK